MANPELAEIKAFARIIDELNYYEILELEPGVDRTSIRDAFHKASRVFHPDGFRDSTQDVSREIDRISKRITEAYTILRSPRRRNTYDRMLAQQRDQVRIPLAEIEAAAEKQAQKVRGGTTPNGRRYIIQAQAEIEQGDKQAAIQSFKLALAYEPKNDYVLEMLESLGPRKKKKNS